MRCKVGDLAIVIRAVNACNIGKIVTVIAPFDGSGDIIMAGEGQQWLVRCSAPLVWAKPKLNRRFVRKSGPVFDDHLQPIRPAGTPARERELILCGNRHQNGDITERTGGTRL